MEATPTALPPAVRDTGVEIREIDPHDESLTHAIWAVGKAADEVGRPWTTYWSWEAARAAFTLPNDSHRKLLLAAYDGAETVGAAEFTLPLLDNTFAGYVEVFVHPDRQRRGTGTALLDASLDVLRRERRRTVMVEAPSPVNGPPSAGVRFLERNGFKIAITDGHRLLDLTATESLWASLAQEAAPHHEGYRIVTWHDVVPDEFLDGYCALQEAFVEEAPMGDLDIESERWDAERVRNKEARFRLARRCEAVTIAVAADGTVAGMTEILVSEHTPQRALQGGTLVLPDHRGHRLGMAMKLANQRAIRERFPHCLRIHTGNADVNEQMNAINDRLGFETVELIHEMQREV